MRCVVTMALLILTATPASAQLFAAVLPSSRAVSLGQPATAFATIVNGGTDTARGCGIVIGGSLPASLTYQTTDATTNTPTGTANTPVDIPPGGSQSFVFAITASATVNSDVPLRFACGSGTTAPITPGVNTFKLLACSGEPLDFIAAVATESRDGVVTIPGPHGTAAFSMAIVNIGPAAPSGECATIGIFPSLNRIPTGSSYRVTPDSSLPVSTSICRTDINGQCVAAPTAYVGFGQSDPMTFSVFVTAKNEIAFAPGGNRVSVRVERWTTFHDATCPECPFFFTLRTDLRPSGSVAVWTSE